MIGKRFRYYEHKGADYILDNPNESLDFIEMLGDCLEAEEVVDLLNTLNDENEQLKSIKNFAERNGINIFSIDEAFYRCWNDNGKLIKENNELQKEIEQLKKRLIKLEVENAELKEENEVLWCDGE